MKLLRVDPEFLIALLNRPFVQYDTLRVPTPHGLPEGTRCLSVHNDYQTRCFLMVIQHESFDVVEPGTIPPTVETSWNMVDVVKVEPTPSLQLQWRLGVEGCAQEMSNLCLKIEQMNGPEQQDKCLAHAANIRGHLETLARTFRPSMPIPHAASASPMAQAIGKEQSNGA